MQKYKKVFPQPEEKISLNINDYEQIQELGEGSFGRVLKMRNIHRPELVVAVKAIDCSHILKDANIQSQGMKEIEEEMKILDIIHSDPIFQPKAFPKYYGYSKLITPSHNIIFYLFFECFHFSLQALLNMQGNLNEKLPFNRVYSYFEDLLIALAFLEIQGICHRDLKPSNILVNENFSRIALTDFGVSKDVSLKMFNFRQTVPTQVGTPPYWAPEIINQTPIINPFKIDVFSFGIVICECLLLRRIRNSPTNQLQGEIDQAIQDLNDVPIAENEQKNFTKFCSIIKKCLTIDHKSRPNFSEIVKEIIKYDDPRKVKLFIVLSEQNDINAMNSLINKGK